MRCFAIAEEIIDRGFQAVFVGEIKNMPWLTARVKQLGFSEIHNLNGSFKSNPESDVLIIDSYNIPPSESLIQERNWLAVISIFDKFTPNYKSKLRIHPGIERVDIKDDPTHTLFGPEYFPIRKSIRSKESSLDGESLRITLIGGGSDPKSFVVEIAKILSEMKDDFRVNVICDPQSTNIIDSRFNYISLGDPLDSLFGKTDLVFTTASTTALEFLCSDCCVAIACSMDNQLENYHVMSDMGIALPIGSFSDGIWYLSRGKISEVISDGNLRTKLRNRAMSYFDLHGVSRIADSIIQAVTER